MESSDSTSMSSARSDAGEVAFHHAISQPESTLRATRSLLKALRDGDLEQVRSSIVDGAKIDAICDDGSGQSVLHLAALHSSPEFLIEVLQRDQKPPFTVDARGDSPLHVSSYCTRSSLAVLLLVSIYGAFCAADRDGNTFLHLLMMNTDIGAHQLVELVTWLLTFDGVRTVLNHTNYQNKTVYEVASIYQSRNNQLLRILLCEGASSGIRINENHIFLLASEEGHVRDGVLAAESVAYETLVASHLKHIALIRKHTLKREKLCSKEESKRLRIVTDEEHTRAAVADKSNSHFFRAERRQRRRLEASAVAFIQRIGRGMLARRLIASLLCSVTATVMGDPLSAASVVEELLQYPAESAELPAAASPLAGENGTLVSTSLCVSDKGTVVATRMTRAAAAQVICRVYVGYCERRRARAAAERKLADAASYDRAVRRCQASARGWAVRCHIRNLGKCASAIQCWWRAWLAVRQARDRAVTVLASELSRFYGAQQRWLFITTGTELVHQERIRGITRAVTQLVWRENFCSAFRNIVFLSRRRNPAPAPRITRFQRWKALTLKHERYLLLAQFLVSLFLLIYMGCIPRTEKTRKHNDVDIAFICVQLVMSFFLPIRWWRVVDIAVIVCALVCAAARAYGGALTITLLTLKLPFVVRGFVPEHSGTRTYCRMLVHSVFYLVLFGPVAVAGVGATVRGSAISSLLLTPYGNWGRVFLYMWSTVSPQYALYLVYPEGTPWRLSSVGVFSNVAGHAQFFPAGEAGKEFVRVMLPPVQLFVFNIVLLLYTWSAIFVGTNGAIRKHYDISDETKLKKNKHRFRNAGKMELLDAHRAANIEALGQQVDGVMWEADIRAAKEAIDASHYDHNTDGTVHRFVRRVQDSVAQGNVTLEAGWRGRHLLPLQQQQQQQQQGKTVSVDHDKWDCRNEDPQSRGKYDVDVIETALGMAVRKGAMERFVERQWTGQIFQRESTFVLVGMLVMAAVKPNLFVMEAIFSCVFVVELLLSLYFLKLDAIFSHFVCLIVRVFCCIVGFIPSAVPFVAFRGLRLLEGWSTIYVLPGMVRWGIMYSFITFLTLWMIAFVAALQFDKENTTDAVLCRGRANCLAISIRDMVLPAWTPEHFAPGREAPLMAMVVVCFQLFFIPFFLSIALHPLLQLSNFIGRFLRLVVQSLHKDVLDYVDNYLEGNSWYSRWELKTDMPVSVITKMKMWVYDSHRRKVTVRHNMQRTNLWSSESSLDSFVCRQATFVDPYACHTEKLETVEEKQLTEIICRSEFASFQENERADAEGNRNQRITVFISITRMPLLHYINAILVHTSIAFLWVPGTTAIRSSATLIVANVIHLLSIISAIVVIPRDLTAVVSVVANCSLFVAVVISFLPTTRFMVYYSLRFISLIRLCQLQIYPYRKIRRFVKTYIYSGIKILFPIIVTGALTFIAELLRAQIYMVRNSSASGNGGNSTAGINSTTTSTSSTTTLSPVASMTYPERLAAVPRRHASRPNVAETAELFAYYFSEDAYILYSIFSFWMLPALCISTALLYLYWSGANLRDTNQLLINIVPLLEDPITVAGFPLAKTHYRWAANVVLIISLVFGCIFSPSTTVTSKDSHLFFGFEIGFTVCGLVEAIFSTAYSVHRCGRTWAVCEAAQLDKRYWHMLVGDSFLFVAEVVELLYYAIAVPLSATLLNDGDNCIISPNEYATYFITLRFVFLLRLLPRQYLLSFMKDAGLFAFAAISMVVYFVGAASALAYCAVVSVTPMTPRLWRSAFDALLRQTFTSATPESFSGLWEPFNGTAVALQMTAAGVQTVEVGVDYTSSRLLFILATIGRGCIASVLGLGIAISLVPLRTQFVTPLPPKSGLLYDTLCGGSRAILNVGTATHDDMRPEVRRKVQSRKFSRIFTATGIPFWALPHLLEELNICRPAHQRRFLYALEWLLVYLFIGEQRQSRIKEYMDVWECYCCGGPAKLNFTTLPVFPPETPVEARNPYTAPTFVTAEGQRYVHPLRLVQALAMFELGFPAESSVGSKLWLDFFTVVQKMRGATLLQSLWRMYCAEKKFEKERSFRERMAIASLRRSFRKMRTKNDVSFRCYSSFKEAVSFGRDVYNPDTGHYDLLNRLSGHYSQLEPTDEFVICNHAVTVSSNHFDTISAYKARRARFL